VEDPSAVLGMNTVSAQVRVPQMQYQLYPEQYPQHAQYAQQQYAYSQVAFAPMWPSYYAARAA
jgi:hypothetical protein